MYLYVSKYIQIKNNFLKQLKILFITKTRDFEILVIFQPIKKFFKKTKKPLDKRSKMF